MTITETFPAPQTKAGGLFWLPNYVRLAQEVYKGYTLSGDDYEREHFVRSCATRWGITRRCSLALLTGEATYDLNPETVTITRTIVEE